MKTHTLVCLANSRKIAGRCVAGISVADGAWVRPVRQSPDGTLYAPDFEYGDGSEAQLLDVIEVPCIQPHPQRHHPEDWIIAQGQPWVKTGELEGSERITFLRSHTETDDKVFGSTSDRVPEEAPAASSLALVEIDDFGCSITTNYRGARQIRGRFHLKENVYDLSITDPQWESRVHHLGFGSYTREECGLDPNEPLFLTLSLGEPFHGSCFKLIAAIVSP